jgi:hypothetical protein
MDTTDLTQRDGMSADSATDTGRLRHYRPVTTRFDRTVADCSAK